MAAIGNIEPFDEANGSWDVYSERLTAYLSANSIDEDKQYLGLPSSGRAELKMELDTGSAYSIISLEEYKKRFAKIPMNTTEVILKTYTQEPVRPEGTLNVAVQYNGVHYNLKLFVPQRIRASSVRTVMVTQDTIDWPAIRQIRKVPKEAKEKLQDILQDHAEVFKNELGTLKNVKARIEVEEDTTPKYVKARPVPYSLRQKVDDEIDRLVKENILEPIDCSEWATPIVPVVKKNGSVRLCGDFKVTLNPVLKRVEYPLPRIEDLLANLSGGQEFTKLGSLQCISTNVGRRRIKKVTHDKVNAVLNAPAPENVSQLRSFLGLLNYYNRFLPNLSMVIRPLNRLLEKGTEWEWSESADTAFKKAKTLLLSADVLVHYNPDLPVTLACDASPYGVGAVLSHITNHGEKPIAFISRTLTKTEQNYAQIDKESLAIVFGVRKFSQYLIGKKFTLITDHQPLVKILGPKTAIPPLAAARFQRWAMMLSAYDYNIVYRNSKNNANADGLSRLPIPEQVPRNVMDAAAVFNMSQLESLPVKSAQVASETKKDNDLSLAMDYTLTGWTKPEVQSLQPFYIRRNELTVQGGCLMWGMRVIIPANLRPVVLNELHIGHPGIVKMKALARSYVWWPNLNEQIEQTVKSCAECMKCQNQPSPAPLHPWRYPDGPWHRIHVDFAGPFMGKMFFVVVDAYSKWPEVVVMNSTTSEKTIDVLRSVFSRHGLPQQLVSDNGPQFVSSEFQQFMARNGVQHITSSPYHPETNGLAERFVQTLKQSLRESVSNSNAPLQQQLSVFLMRYRNTPHSTTKEAPAVLLIGRRLRSRLDLLKPNIAMTVAEAQEKQIQERGAGKVRTDTFEPNQPVLARNYREGAKWVPGTVVDKSGPVSYKVQVNPGSVWRRHTDQLLPCSNPVMAGDVSASSINLEQTAELPECANPVITSETDTDSDKQIPAQERRYPVRERRPPNRLDL
ncbi:uncharacterized protein K02A2.6-like [Haliotis rubra]|uniref:uncharacterized protein K02A2.6-like n=1 Tax=Haliotis rubra TaxID=36100 RepID=UPI001EE546C1|nr:uncharacterized protein K02A2.6-like [Haliotis rubra]